MTRLVVKVHRLVGVVSGALVLVAALTALGLNHRDLFRSSRAARESGPFGRYLLCLAADPADPRHLLAGTSEGLFASGDGGATWQRLAMPLPDSQAVAVVFDGRGGLYACFRQSGLCRSSDGGRSWEVVPTPPGEELAGLALQGGSPILLTPRGVYRLHQTEWHLEPRPGPRDPDPGRSLVQLLYNLHDGQFWGRWGTALTDAVAAALVILVTSGFYLYRVRPGR